jgi:hypothetical protein
MTQPRQPVRRLYIDESGDHSPCGDEDGIGKRYLGLVGVMFERGAAYETFAADLEALKKRHFHSDPDDPLVLHRGTPFLRVAIASTEAREKLMPFDMSYVPLAFAR